MGWFALGLACVIGVATRFWHLGADSLFSDEAFTFAMSGLGLPALLQTLSSSDYHPPMFYLITHFIMQWLHWPPWDYRYLSAPFGIITIVATWGAARRMFGPTAAAIASLLVALSPALIVYDRMYRMYAPLVALATLSFWVLLEAEHAAGRRRMLLWTAYAVLALVLAYTHYLAFIVLGCQALYCAMRFRTAAPALGAFALVVLAYMPWVSHLRSQLPLGALALSRPGFDVGLATSVRDAFAMGMPNAPSSWTAGIWLPLGAVGAVLIAAGWLGRRSALPFWLAALPLAVVASIGFGANLAYFPRYLLIDIPAVAIGIGLIASSLVERTRTQLVGWIVALLAILICAFGTTNVLLDPYYQFPDWYAVNATLLQSEHAGDAIILDAGYELLVVQNYTAFRGHTMLSFMNPSDFAPILGWSREHPRVRVWYVQHQNFYWDPNQRIASTLAQRRPILMTRRFPRQSAVNDVTVLLFDKVPMKR